MAKLIAEIDLSEINQKLEAIHSSVARLEQLIPNVSQKSLEVVKPIPQKAAMKELEVTFPTFKKLCLEFKVRPIKRNGRLFYRPSDISRMLNGQK